VLRRNFPGRGWKKLDITGTVRAERRYYDIEGRPTMAPGGPPRLGRNSAGDSWMGWYESRTLAWGRIVDGRWFGIFDNRQLLEKHLQDEESVEAALRTFPGVFTNRLKEDFDVVTECLHGRSAPLTADALAFRGDSEAIEKDVAAAGDKAWSEFLAANNAVESLASLHLVRDDRAPIIGKVIALEDVSWYGAVVEGDRTVFTTEHSGYPCFIATDQPAMREFWNRQSDYQARVEPRLPEKYDLVGRVGADTRLVIGRRGALIGLNIEVLAVRVAGHFFADLMNAAIPFAGAERMALRRTALPADDASPSDVMRAYIAAVKVGDEKVWQLLYADWVAIGGEGRPFYRAFDRYTNYLSDFTRSRNLILHKVCHAEPVWESDAHFIVRGDEFPDAPKVEQAIVVMDHIGRFDEGDVVFATIELHRVWELQRVNGGPWRIASRNIL
jgi:hypothetical protein